MKKLLIILAIAATGCTSTCDEVKDKRALHNEDWTTIIYELYIGQDGVNEWVIVDEQMYWNTYRGDCYRD